MCTYFESAPVREVPGSPWSTYSEVFSLRLCGFSLTTGLENRISGKSWSWSISTFSAGYKLHEDQKEKHVNLDLPHECWSLTNIVQIFFPEHRQNSWNKELIWFFQKFLRLLDRLNLTFSVELKSRSPSERGKSREFMSKVLQKSFPVNLLPNGICSARLIWEQLFKLLPAPSLWHTSSFLWKQISSGELHRPLYVGVWTPCRCPREWSSLVKLMGLCFLLQLTRCKLSPQLRYFVATHSQIFNSQVQNGWCCSFSFNLVVWVDGLFFLMSAVFTHLLPGRLLLSVM